MDNNQDYQQQPYQQQQYQQQQYQQPQYQQQYQQQQYQPNYAQGQQPPTKPDNYLVWAILTTLFCCLPLGIFSIVYASKVDSLYCAGDFLGAQSASDNAKKFAIWSAASVAIAVGIYLIIGLIIVIADNM